MTSSCARVLKSDTIQIMRGRFSAPHHCIYNLHGNQELKRKPYLCIRYNCYLDWLCAWESTQDDLDSAGSYRRSVARRVPIVRPPAVVVAAAATDSPTGSTSSAAPACDDRSSNAAASGNENKLHPHRILFAAAFTPPPPRPFSQRPPAPRKVII